MGILNTMNNEILSAITLLEGSNISILDAARLVRNILDSFSQSKNLSHIQFCSKIIETGKRHFRTDEMPIKDGFVIYLNAKQDLRPDSLKDIRYLGGRLMKAFSGKFAQCNFSELGMSDCQKWLSETFTSAPQFNKARAMLHGLFEFALRHQWCDRNIVKFIARRKVVEKPIAPLVLPEIKRLIETAKSIRQGESLAAVGLLTYAGIRPREVLRLTWRDIDLQENTITVKSECSKTGGIRQVEICPALRRILAVCVGKIEHEEKNVCPKNWHRRWKAIRDKSGFKGIWVQDILRHTYASFHAKRFRDMPRLQINMGHRDISLLRYRYVNMRGISHAHAHEFFS